MQRLEKGLIASLLAGVLLAAGCGGEDPVEPEPEPAPPDLTGTYTLLSFASGVLTAGNALTPPDVSGMFTVERTSVTGGEAGGTFEMTVSVPDNAGGTTTIVDQGTYRNYLEGRLEQEGEAWQSRGTYELDGNTLTIEVSEPALAISKTVWQRE